jgi:hypothetical protein
MSKPGPKVCSFCNKPHTRHLVQNPTASVWLCEECIILCLHMIAEGDEKWLAHELAGLLPRLTAARTE